MKSYIYGNPEILNTLKTLVETREGVDMCRWTEIAKQLEGMFNIHISKPCELRVVYELLQNPNDSLTEDQAKLQIKLVLANWGVLKKAQVDFQNQTKLTMEYKKFKTRVYKQYKKAIEIGIQVYISRKSEYKKRLIKLQGTCIERVLKCKTIVQNDEFTQKLKRMSEVFAALLEVSINIQEDELSQMYDSVTSVLKKKDFHLLLNAISFMFDLYCIKEGSLTKDEQLSPDYWLQPTIQQNKALTVYKFFFEEDRIQKFLMFNQATDVQQEMDYKLYVNKNPIHSKIATSFQEKKAKLKTVRGRITLDDKKYPNQKTIKFKEEEDSDEGFFEFNFGRKQNKN